jgi:hypothetical protein
MGQSHVKSQQIVYCPIDENTEVSVNIETHFGEKFELITSHLKNKNLTNDIFPKNMNENVALFYNTITNILKEIKSTKDINYKVENFIQLFKFINLHILKFYEEIFIGNETNMKVLVDVNNFMFMLFKKTFEVENDFDKLKKDNLILTNPKNENDLKHNLLQLRVYMIHHIIPGLKIKAFYTN